MVAKTHGCVVEHIAELEYRFVFEEGVPIRDYLSCAFHNISPVTSPYCALIEVAGVEEQEVVLVRHLRSQFPKLVVHPGDAADALFVGVR